jgi:leucyl aminopeptidase
VPTFRATTDPLTELDAEVLVVFATAGRSADAGGAVLGADAIAAGQALGVDLAAELAAVRFEGKLGAVGRVPTRAAAPAALLLVVGLDLAAAVDLERLRRAAGAAVRNATKDARVGIAVPLDLLPAGTATVDAVQAVVEGAGLGAYSYTEYRTKSPDAPAVAEVLVRAEGADPADVERGIAQGLVMVRATSITRDLVNTPPGAKRPPVLAERVRALAEDAGLSVRIFDEDALSDGGFGGILGVGQGSSARPRLVELTYSPGPDTGSPSGHVVLVGKGITFDTGGISLKPSASMNTMKSDMSGAAAVLGAMTALGELGVTTKVTGLLALAENMPGGDAIRVSDVLVQRGGTTVEVMNTDAEGRLVLADALAYGAESSPDLMIDLATLTGAQIVALGTQICGLMGTDDALVGELQQAAAAAGERVWHLPLPEDYAEHLRSEVADLRNIGRPGQAGTLVAGLFLKEFTAGIPWAHLDIAGPAFSEDGDSFYNAKGATGFGVRTLVRFLTTHRVSPNGG